MTNTTAGANKPAPQGNTANVRKEMKARTISFQLSVPTCITLGIGCVLSVLAVFFLGVILGRGYMPEEKIPQLGSVMPQSTTPTPARVVGEGGAPASSGQSESPMTAPELAYREALKESPATPARQQPRVEPSTRPQVSSPATVTQQATAEQLEEVFDYKFQIAAFRSQAQADAFTARLNADGFRAITEISDNNGSIWYKNIILFRGTPDDVTLLREQLKAYNITTLIRKAKDPVL